MQLTKLKTQNYSFIPDILAPESIYHSTTTSNDSCYNSDSSSPASPTPSLDSVGSVEGCDVFRSSCLVKSRRQKRSRQSSSVIQQQCNGGESAILNKRARKRHNSNNNNNSYMTCAQTPTYNNNFDMYNLAPLPSPDFDDLVDCMLTEEALNQIDVTNYLPAL